MAELVADCPRCKAQKITFDVKQSHLFRIKNQWQHFFETFCICRHCNLSTVFLVSSKLRRDGKTSLGITGPIGVSGVVNDLVDIVSYVSLKDTSSVAPPEYLPEAIESSFNEGARCLPVECYNAAATMFRLCVDLATRRMLPADDIDGLNSKIRRNLGFRLPWLFDTGRLPEALRDLSSCIKEDGNDGAHEGTLSKEDAEDLLDFTTALLERIYTEPERIRLAKERRAERRAVNSA